MIWYLRKEGKELDYEATRVLEEALKLNVPIKIVHPSHIDILVNRSDRKSIRVDSQIVNLPSLVLPRTGSGTDYYSLSVLRHLERLNVPIVNSPWAIEASMDKFHSMQILAQHNLPIPRTMLVRFPVDADLVEKQIGYPCVIKVLSGSYGKGVHLVQNKEGLVELMEFVSSLNTTINILIQEYISSKPGKDLRVIVIGGKPVGAMLRESQDGSFKANITRGGLGSSFEMNEEIHYLAVETAKVLGLDIAGVDLLFDKEGYKICEANSAPGFEGFERACQINLAKEIVQYCSFRSIK